MSPDLIAQVETHLFSTPEELSAARLSPAQRERLLRLREFYFYWRDHPLTSERELVGKIQRRSRISTSAAYEDLRLLRVILGKMTQSPQDYHRWVFLQRFEQVWEMAVKEEDRRTLERLLNTYGKYNRLDAPADQVPAYSEIVPPFLTITADPTVAGFKPIKNAREIAARLEQRFISELETSSGLSAESPNPDSHAPTSDPP